VSPRETKDTTPTLLELDELEEGTTRWSFEIAAAELDLEDQYLTVPKPVQVSLSVVCSIHNFSVAGTIHFEVAAECSRCLAATTQAVDATVKVLIQRKEASGEELEAIEDQDGVDIVHPGTQTVDLKRHLRDSAMIELPTRIQCSPNCQGLCSQCGQDLNAGPCHCAELRSDPRWSALADLKNDLH
jgi:uncharacterized protein